MTQRVIGRRWSWSPEGPVLRKMTECERGDTFAHFVCTRPCGLHVIYDVQSLLHSTPLSALARNGITGQLTHTDERSTSVAVRPQQIER